MEKQKKGESAVQIVYASDDRFAEIMGVSIVSLFENNKNIDEINVYILDSCIANNNKEKIELVCQSYKRQNPIWIQAKDISQELNMEVALDRGSLSQYARLFVSSVLPEHLNRVLYLDCDIIINQSIEELWNLDMKGKTIAALMDAFSKHYRSNIGLAPNDVMFNSGVMLIDLNRWREQKVEEKLLRFIIDRKGKIQQGDQGALNGVLSHDTFCFEPRFNSVTIFHDFTYDEMLIYRKPPSFYDEKQIIRAVNTPLVIHFTTSFLSDRPWIKGCKHRYVDEWMRYKEMSPWFNMELYKDNRSIWEKKGLAIYKLLPDKVSVYIAGLVQAYIRPFINRLRLIKK